MMQPCSAQNVWSVRIKILECLRSGHGKSVLWRRRKLQTRSRQGKRSRRRAERRRLPACSGRRSSCRTSPGSRTSGAREFLRICRIMRFAGSPLRGQSGKTRHARAAAAPASASPRRSARRISVSVPPAETRASPATHPVAESSRDPTSARARSRSAKPGRAAVKRRIAEDVIETPAQIVSAG